jgi:hypothetical protein
MDDTMNDDELVVGVVRVRVIDPKGYVLEEAEYRGMISDTEGGSIRDTNGGAAGWYILVGTEDQILYRGGAPEAGRVRVLDKGYPEVEEEGGKRRLVYRATFAADSLNARKINGAVLVYRTSKREQETETETEMNPLQGVAYARISPALRIGLDDMLRIEWECQYQAREEMEKCLDR